MYWCFDIFAEKKINFKKVYRLQNIHDLFKTLYVNKYAYTIMCLINNLTKNNSMQ